MYQEAVCDVRNQRIATLSTYILPGCSLLWRVLYGHKEAPVWFGLFCIPLNPRSWRHYILLYITLLIIYIYYRIVTSVASYRYLLYYIILYNWRQQIFFIIFFSCYSRDVTTRQTRNLIYETGRTAEIKGYWMKKKMNKKWW